jgi:cystathionine gamma-lyase
VLQSLGPGAHLLSVNDVYGGTFRYMTQVASEGQGLETTFIDLETADDDTIIASLQPNTKVSFRVLISFTEIISNPSYDS